MWFQLKIIIFINKVKLKIAIAIFVNKKIVVNIKFWVIANCKAIVRLKAIYAIVIVANIFASIKFKNLKIRVRKYKL